MAAEPQDLIVGGHQWLDAQTSETVFHMFYKNYNQ